MFLLLLTIACSQAEEEVWGVWEGDPQEAEQLSEYLEVGEGSEIKVKLLERDGVLWGHMRLEGELRFAIYGLEEDEGTWDETDDIQLNDDGAGRRLLILGSRFRSLGLLRYRRMG